MTVWTPEWSIQINGTTEYANLTIANMTVTSGRTDIYSQAIAGYASLEILNLNLSTVVFDVNDSILVRVKDSAGAYVNIYGGFINSVTNQVISSGTGGVNESILITALGALSKLPKSLTDGVLAKDFDGNQIEEILSEVLFLNWINYPSVTWAGSDPAVTWEDAGNNGLGEIDTPGDYELAARSSSRTDIYSLVSFLATSGLGYLYEDAFGRISYADSTHRTEYLTANGYTYVSANDALAAGIQTSRKLGDLRNSVTIKYKNDAEVSASDLESILQYGRQAAIISTSIEDGTDAQSQADFYLSIRAFPQDQFTQISYTLGNPELDDGDRDSLLNVFMGLPLDISDLPVNMVDGRFQGFVEGWSWRTGYNRLDLTLTLSPVAYSLQATRWNGVSVAESWNTIENTLTWNNAIFVA
jgi:hypothetical protein